MNFKGAIFDLDGTILDSTNVWKKVDEQFFAGESMSVPDKYMEKINSMNIYDIAIFTIKNYHVNYTPENLVKKWNEMAYSEYANNVLIKPYVKEYLLKLKEKGIKLGIATALDKELFTPCLKRNGIFDLFDFKSSLTDIKGNKQNPDVYLYVAKNLGLEAFECVVFEDIEVAVESAKKANFYTIGVYDETTNSKNFKNVCDKFIYSFKELL